MILLQELKAVQQQIFGPLKTLSEEEYMRIYQTTGIEIDDRRDVLQTRLREFTAKVIKHFVKFVKAIPGFDQLPIEDQTSLLKGENSILLTSFADLSTELKLLVLIRVQAHKRYV
jgi:hypothetical protein